MLNKIPLIIFSLIFFSCQQKKIEPKKYKPEWNSLSKHNESPKWFEDARGFKNLEQGLKKVGFQETEVNDILGNNWYNFYRGIST